MTPQCPGARRLITLVQTPAEKHLVQSIITLLGSGDAGDVAPILNIGAGKSVVIENQLSEAGVRYRCDRVDVDDCSVEHPSVDKCWTCSVERMDPVASDAYTVAFTNYVLEHVAELNRAATEIYRVLRPEGVFLASVPNTLAPEFWLSRRTPLRFHKWLRRGDAWETQYAYKNVADLAAIFEAHSR